MNGEHHYGELNRPQTMKGENPMKAKETALVLIEFQNEFCKEGGQSHDPVKSEMARQNMIPNAVKLVENARKKGAWIIYAPYIFDEEYYNKFKMQGIIKQTADSTGWRRGSWGVEIIDELKPQPGDKILQGKTTLCAFNHTDLEPILRENKIRNVVLAGFMTNFCIEGTARTAYDRGYSVTVIKNAIATSTPEEQKFTEEKIFPALGQLMTVDQFLNQMEA
jgi:nicotinamidase-related amidase